MNIPNCITGTRLLLTPVAWYAALADCRWLLVIIILICLLTDFLDGFFARLLNQATSFGAKLDSAADNILLVSAVPIAWLTDPSLLHKFPILTAGFLFLLVAVFTTMFVKHGRMVEIHTYASKFGAPFMWIFLIHGWTFGYSYILALVFYASSYFYLIEDLALLITRTHLDEEEPGYFFRSLGTKNPDGSD